MQKAKFQIKGMHCNSCATLIGEKLKDLDGVMKAKVDFDSQKAVVVYDETKITENDLNQTIKGAGDYQISKIENGDGLEERQSETGRDTGSSFIKEEGRQSSLSKIMLCLGFLVGFSLFSLILNIVLLSKIYSSNSSKNIGTKIIQGQNFPTDNSQPSPSVPTPPAPAPIAQFEITKNNHVRGDFNALITLVEFSDFECPFCERHYPTLNKILNDYKGKIRLVYKHFPLGLHPNAQKAAEASECADEQGNFWEYHDKLFENQPQGYSLDKFKQWAKDLGLNTKKFNDCLDSDKYAQKVQTDYQEGFQKGVSGTPATFVNGQLITGAVPYEIFKQTIDELLNQ